MGRELEIYGIKKSEFNYQLQTKLKAWNLPKNESNSFLTNFKYNISIKDKINLENYLYKQIHLTIEEQHEYFAVKELVNYQSKQICYAIAQLVDYYNNKFSWDSKESKFDSFQGSMMLKKHEISKLLNWLILIGLELAEIDKENYRNLFPNQLIKNARQFIIDKYCKGNEFDYYVDYIDMFKSWKQKIEKTNFDHYYWCDSF